MGVKTVRLDTKSQAMKACLDALASLPPTAWVTGARVWEFNESVGGGWSWVVTYSTSLGWEHDRTNNTAEKAALAVLEHGEFDH